MKPSLGKALSIVYARTPKGGIGLNGTLPWKLKNELKHFKRITTSDPIANTVIMGRKTFESMGSNPLPNRTNIIVSNSLHIQQTSTLLQARSLSEAIAKTNPKGSAYVIGGAQLIEEALPHAQYVFETLISKEVPCDTFIKVPNIPSIYIGKTQTQNGLNYDFRVYSSVETDPPAIMRDYPPHQELQYLKQINTIIREGEEKIDRTSTGTLSIFGGQARYDLSSSFPLLTHKKVYWKGIVEELLWFISGSTNGNTLEQNGVKIWKGHGTKEYLSSRGFPHRLEGDLGPVYGFQWRHWNAPYKDHLSSYQGQGIDQLKELVNAIKTDPNSRRLILTAWNPEQLSLMALPPCHVLAQFEVSSKGRLSCLLYQRSCDMGLGVPFNIASYALLTCMLAHVCGLERGELVHSMGNMHVYTNHVEPLKSVIKRSPYPFPQLQLNSRVTNIFDFKREHIKLDDYLSHETVKMEMSV